MLVYTGMETHRKLLDTAQIAEALNVCRNTVRAWARAGKIPFIRPSKQVMRFDLEAVIKALSAPRAEGTNRG